MTDSKPDWKNFFLAIVAIVVGFALAAWGVFTLNKILHPGEYLACPYGYQPIDAQKPECTPAAVTTATPTSLSTGTQTSSTILDVP